MNFVFFPNLLRYKKQHKKGIKMKKIQITREDIRKEQIQVNQYFKKESFLLKNLHNKKYEYKIEEFKNVFVIQYKKINHKKFKEFILVKNFFTFKREYEITEEKLKLVNELLKKIN